MKRMHGFLTLAVVLGLLAGACAAGTSAPASARVIYMSAVEYKGGTDVAKEAFPASAVPVGGGYILKEPKDGRWETSTYRFEPGMVVVQQGDTVELHIWGVNGAQHPGRIEGYAGTDFNVTRGQLTVVKFVADKAGIFRILCDAHLPSMTGQLVVLARQ